MDFYNSNSLKIPRDLPLFATFTPPKDRFSTPASIIIYNCSEAIFLPKFAFSDQNSANVIPANVSLSVTSATSA